MRTTFARSSSQPLPEGTRSKPAFAASSMDTRYVLRSSAAHPDHLKRVRRELRTWADLRQDGDSEGARLRRRMVLATDSEVQVRSKVQEIGAEIRSLETVIRTTKDAVVRLHAKERLAILEEDRLEADRLVRLACDDSMELTCRLAEVVSRHNRIVRALHDGSITVQTDRGGFDSHIGSTEADRLVEESHKLVGERLPKDDVPYPVPPQPSVLGPASWHVPSSFNLMEFERGRALELNRQRESKARSAELVEQEEREAVEAASRRLRDE